MNTKYKQLISNNHHQKFSNICLDKYIYIYKYMSTLCWLIEVIGIFLFIVIYLFFIIVNYLGGMVSPCRYTQSSNKRINVEGCKNTIGSEPINKMNTRL